MSAKTTIKDKDNEIQKLKEQMKEQAENRNMIEEENVTGSLKTQNSQVQNNKIELKNQKEVNPHQV